VDSFDLCFLRILHPTARCPDLPFLLGLQVFVFLKSYLRQFLFGNSLEGNCQLGLLIFFDRLLSRILEGIYCMT